MANVCIYQTKVKGAELNCHKLIDMMPLYEGEKHIYLKESEGHECVLLFSGDCKWSVDSYTNRRMEVELFTSAELEKIEDGDYWDMPLAQKAKALSVEVWCCSKDSDEGGPVIYEHYDKSGNLVRDKCPGEIALKKGYGREELNMPLETLYNVKFANGGTYSYHGNGVEYEIGDIVNVEGAKKGILGQVIGTERTKVHKAYPILQKLGHCAFFCENDFEEIWKSLKPTQREKMFMLYGTEKLSKVQYLQYQFTKWLEFAIEEDNWNHFVEDCKSFLKENNILAPVHTETPSKKRENKKKEKESSDIKNLRKLWAFRTTKDGGLCLTGYKGTDTEITLPYRIGENEITTIKWKGNADHPVTHIHIPEGVTNIDDAFSGCTELTSVRIPDSVTSMKGTFSGCTNLTSVHIPSSVTYIGGFTFFGCTNLTSVHIPSSVTSMGLIFGYGNDCRKVTFYVPSGSYAETYAKENGISFVVE